MEKSTLSIKVKRLKKEAKLPSQKHSTDACWDLTCVTVKESSDLFIEYGTGLAIEVPEGYVGLVFPRSSVSNYSLNLANSVGVIDHGYTGEVTARFRRDSSWFNADLGNISQAYAPGDRILQLMVIPRPKLEMEEVKELSNSERATGGYGSTGK